MLGRLLGVVMLLIGLSGIAVSVAGVIGGRQAVDLVGVGLEEALLLTTDSLATVVDTLVLAKTTVSDVNTTLDTVEVAIVDAGQTITETRPLLMEISDVTSQEVPNSLEAVQQTIPNLELVAATIDDTLTTLNQFRIDETLSVPNPFGGEPLFTYDFNYDLGIDYDPAVPFEQSVTQIGGSLDGLAPHLTDLSTQIDVVNDNLEVISKDVLAIASDLSVINERVAEIDPLLDEYIRLVTEVNDQIRRLRTGATEQLETVKLAITIVMVWFGLMQLAPLYLGWELASGQRGRAHKPVEDK